MKVIYLRYVIVDYQNHMIESIHTDIKLVKRNVDYLQIVLDVYKTIGRYSNRYAYSFYILLHKNQKCIKILKSHVNVNQHQTGGAVADPEQRLKVSWCLMR